MSDNASTGNPETGPGVQDRTAETQRLRTAAEIAEHVAAMLRGEIDGVKPVAEDDGLFPVTIKGVPAVEARADILGLKSSGVALMDLGGYAELAAEEDLNFRVAFNAGYLAALQAFEQRP